jgi:hypothetical protein
MSGFSPERAMAMERRHIAEGEKRVARQKVLTGELIEKGYYRIAEEALGLLKIMRETLELTRERLRYLEGRYVKDSKNQPN